MVKTPLSSRSLSTGVAAGFAVALIAGGCLQDLDKYNTSGGAAATSSSASSGSGPGPNSSSTQASSTQASTSSGMVECVPGDSCSENPPNPCTMDECVANVCTHTPVADGPLGADPDPTDCTFPVCVAGAPDEANVAENEPCGRVGMDMQCNDMGVCVGCLDPVDCDPMGQVDHECFTHTCSAMGECGQMVKPAAPLDSVPAEDCLRRACDGTSPDPVLVPDPTDVDDDGIDCTIDGCDGNNMPTHMDAPAGTVCDDMGGSICDMDGACCMPANPCNNVVCGMQATGCDTNVACTCGNAALPACVANTCRECDNDNQCTTNNDGHDCLPTNVCGCDMDGDCAGIANRTQCFNGTCQECNADPDCSANTDGDDCLNGTCGCNGDNDCGSPCRRCDLGTSTCVNRADGTAGDPASGGGFACNGSGAFYTDCSNGNQGTHCVDDTCSNAPNCN